MKPAPAKVYIPFLTGQFTNTGQQLSACMMQITIFAALKSFYIYALPAACSSCFIDGL